MMQRLLGHVFNALKVVVKFDQPLIDPASFRTELIDQWGKLRGFRFLERLLEPR